MNFKNAIFAIIITGLIIATATIILGGWASQYNSGITSDLDEYNQIGELSDTATEHQGKINPQSGEASSDFETDTFRGVYGIITNIFAPFRIVFGSGGMIDSLAERFGIPEIYIQVIITMMVFAIIFGIVAIIFRLSRSSA